MVKYDSPALALGVRSLQNVNQEDGNTQARLTIFCRRGGMTKSSPRGCSMDFQGGQGFQINYFVLLHIIVPRENVNANEAFFIFTLKSY